MPFSSPSHRSKFGRLSPKNSPFVPPPSYLPSFPLNLPSSLPPSVYLSLTTSNPLPLLPPPPHTLPAQLLLADHAGSMHVINCSTGAPMKMMQPHSAEVSSLVYVGERRHVISVSWDQYILVQDESQPNMGKLIRSTPSGHQCDVTCAAYSQEACLPQELALCVRCRYFGLWCTVSTILLRLPSPTLYGQHFFVQSSLPWCVVYFCDRYFFGQSALLDKTSLLWYRVYLTAIATASYGQHYLVRLWALLCYGYIATTTLRSPLL